MLTSRYDVYSPLSPGGFSPQWESNPEDGDDELYLQSRAHEIRLQRLETAKQRTLLEGQLEDKCIL